MAKIAESLDSGGREGISSSIGWAGSVSNISRCVLNLVVFSAVILILICVGASIVL